MEANTQLINYNLMASFRTGNVIIDMAIAMLVPQLMSWLVNLFNFLLPLLERGIDRLMQRRFRRVIVHSFEARPYLDIQTSNRNGILQNAIRQYIGRELQSPYHEGVVKLSKIQSSSTSSKTSGSVVEQLEKVFRMIHLPQREVMEEIEPGLFYMESLAKIGENPDEEGGGRGKKKTATKTVISLVLECDKRLGEGFITAFVDRAYKWYLEQVEKDEDKSRFMYQPLVRDKFATVDERKKQRIYKRYELSSDKTFRSLFFPEKDRLLRILDNFSSKQGKYAIKGFPHKLGLLLHGPPGTGKTSLVKAIATYTGRNIISVPLSRIHTNQELMDVMFDQQFNFQAPKKSADDGNGDDDKGTDNKLSFDKVIFLLEDVDAASKVVHARAKQSTMARRVTQAVERQYTSEGPLDGADIPSPSAPSPQPSSAEKLIEQQKVLLQLFKSQSGKGESKGDGGENGKSEASGDGIEAKKEGYWLSDKDKLNLSGLLTVLDGVIDAPGRILIMTTNHPEKLDPALTRPGRVNLQIYMGFIRPDQAKEMVRHYYRDDATDAALECVVKTFEAINEELRDTAVGSFKLTPAEMEQLCAECITIDELTQRLLAKGRSALSNL